MVLHHLLVDRGRHGDPAVPACGGEPPVVPVPESTLGPEGRQTDGIGSTLTAGRPLPGRDVWIDAGDGLPAADGVEGEIIVDGRFGTVGQRVGRTPDGRQRVRTGDRGILAPDGTLTVTGRLGRDGKVGLWRVDLRALETAIASIEGVIDVAVRPDGPDDAVRGGCRIRPPGRSSLTSSSMGGPPSRTRRSTRAIGGPHLSRRAAADRPPHGRDAHPLEREARRGRARPRRQRTKLRRCAEA